MKKMYKDLPLRSGVGIVVLNKENQIFLAKRIDNPKNFWQMPQGGVDGDEEFYEAAIRELFEETSIKTEDQENKDSEQLFDQDLNEEEDFEIPAFLRKQKF